MKICLLIFEISSKSGGVRLCLELGKSLQEKGHSVAIYTTRFDHKKTYTNLVANLDVYSLKTKPPLDGFLKKLFLERGKRLFLAEKLSKIIKKKDFDLLVPIEWPANWAAAMVKIKRGIPIIWICNDIWHIPDYSRPDFGFFGRLDQVCNILFRQWIDRYLTKQVDKIVILSERIKKIVDGYYHIDSVVIRSGVDVSKFTKKTDSRRIRKRHSFQSDDFLVLSLSIFYPHRRFEDIIEAARSLPETKVMIIGDATYSPRYFNYLKHLTKQYNLSNRVKIINKVISEEEMPAYYQACDVFVFACEKQTWGMAPLEAMAVGRPAIVSRGSGVHEVLTTKENALLIPPRNPEKLARAIKLIKNNHKLRKKIAANGKKFVSKTFSWERYAQQVLDLV